MLFEMHKYVMDVNSEHAGRDLLWDPRAEQKGVKKEN